MVPPMAQAASGVDSAGQRKKSLAVTAPFVTRTISAIVRRFGIRVPAAKRATCDWLDPIAAAKACCDILCSKSHAESFMRCRPIPFRTCLYANTELRVNSDLALETDYSDAA